MLKNAVLITGGAGFIGSNYIPYFLEQHQDTTVVNIDKLTYAGDLKNLADVQHHKNYTFVEGDICNRAFIEKLFELTSNNSPFKFEKN